MKIILSKHNHNDEERKHVGNVYNDDVANFKKIIKTKPQKKGTSTSGKCTEKNNSIFVTLFHVGQHMLLKQHQLARTNQHGQQCQMGRFIILKHSIIL